MKIMEANTIQSADTLFETYRKTIEALAYRMLGSWADAQDIAQDAFVKWHSLSLDARSEIREPKAWLHTVATRLCLDRLKSAQRQREQYVGPWLPEPLLRTDETPADQAAQDDTITMALMLAMERLSPSERAAFLLHDVFGHPFAAIALILSKEVAACRQLASRARAAIRAERKKYELEPEQHKNLIAAFFAAIAEGDASALEALLAEDVVLYSDGGGIAPAARKILRTRDIVSRLFLGLAKKARRLESGETVRIANINGLPAALLYRSGNLETIISLSVSKGRIQNIFQQRNPQKLRSLQSPN